MKIAIVGSGISGLSLAWMLQSKYNVTLFEQNNYLGGHSNTVDIQYNNKEISVDTGFIVFNHKTYPHLVKLFNHLSVKTEKSNMSFGIKDCDYGLEYCGSGFAGLFAQKKNILNPLFIKMIFDITKFNKESINAIEKNHFLQSKETIYEFINKLQLSEYFKNYYLFPMASAIWSCSLEVIKNYPAKTFLQFFYNHGLLTVKNQPQWYTVSGGSKNYVKKFADHINDIRLNVRIQKCIRHNNSVVLEDDNDNKHEFNHVIFASHPNQTLDIVKDLSKKEQQLLSSIKYNKNTAILHRDESQMPKNNKAWASWVYLSSQKQNKVSLTYWMNNLQNIDKKYPLFVTLNPFQEIPQEKIFGTYEYEHPVFTQNAIDAQEGLDEIQDNGNIWYCGAWMKYGFHEDGLNSAIKIAKKFDCLPECLL